MIHTDLTSTSLCVLGSIYKCASTWSVKQIVTSITTIFVSRFCSDFHSETERKECKKLCEFLTTSSDLYGQRTEAFDLNLFPDLILDKSSDKIITRLTLCLSIIFIVFLYSYVPIFCLVSSIFCFLFSFIHFLSNFFFSFFFLKLSLLYLSSSPSLSFTFL